MTFFEKTIKTIQLLHTHLYLGVKIMDFDFFLAYIKLFSPSVDSEATVDHFNDLKSYLCFRNIPVEFKALSKSGHGTEIRQLHAEISILFHHKPSEITIFQIRDGLVVSLANIMLMTIVGFREIGSFVCQFFFLLLFM